LEKLLADGKVRAIGVSNFMVDHLTALLDATSVVPAVNQLESPSAYALSGQREPTVDGEQLRSTMVRTRHCALRKARIGRAMKSLGLHRRPR
jgi:predicted oxidoreductase